MKIRKSKIVIVLYCYAVNDWNKRLISQLERIKIAGLYDSAYMLNLVITDVDGDSLNILTSIIDKYPKWKLTYTRTNNCEATALTLLDDIARGTSSNENYKILYLHTKGVFNRYKNFETMELDNLKINGIKCWVDILETCLVDRWIECAEELNDNDTVGATNNNNWWWGNMWWANSTYIKQITPFSTYYNGSRWSAEAWLHETSPDISSIKFKELYKFQFDPYYTIIPRYFYDQTDISDLRLKIHKIEYGCFKNQTDEGRPVPIGDPIVEDVTDLLNTYITENSINISDSIISSSIKSKCENNPRSFRIYFSTDRDPTNTYVISTFFHYDNRLNFSTNDKFYI
jgi:hypothetical protein